MYYGVAMVTVSGHKKCCWRKVVIVKKYGSSSCETTYELTKKLHNCRL